MDSPVALTLVYQVLEFLTGVLLLLMHPSGPGVGMATAVIRYLIFCTKGDSLWPREWQQVVKPLCLALLMGYFKVFQPRQRHS